MMGLIPRDFWEYRLDDFFLAAYGLLKSKNSDETINIKELGRVLTAKSGRAALGIALKALKFPHQAKIGVPLFCCPVVFEAIVMSGAEPVFIDCDEDTFCLSPNDLEKKISFIDGLIVVHMFGVPADLNRITDIARGIPIIEDCAQSLGSKYYGQPLGTYGKIAIFSFRSGKYISAGEGGAIFSSDLSLIKECASLINEFPPHSLPIEMWHLAQMAVKSFLRQRPLYGVIGYKIWSIRSKYINSSNKENVSLGRIFRSDLILIKKRLQKFEQEVNKQRMIADIYQRELKLPREMLCLEKTGKYFNRLYFPVLFPSKEKRNMMAEALWENKIDSMKYLDNLIMTARYQYGYRGGCPQSESLSERVLNIPCYHGLKEKDIEKIIKTVNKTWEKIDGTRI